MVTDTDGHGVRLPQELTCGRGLVPDDDGHGFASPGGTGLLGLGKELRPRCEELIRRKGERLPK